MGLVLFTPAVPLAISLGFGVFFPVAFTVLCFGVFLIASLTFGVRVMIKGEPDLSAPPDKAAPEPRDVSDGA